MTQVLLITDDSVRWTIDGGEFFDVSVDGEEVHFERYIGDVEDRDLRRLGGVTVGLHDRKLLHDLLDLIDAPSEVDNLEVTLKLARRHPVWSSVH